MNKNKIEIWSITEKDPTKKHGKKKRTHEHLTNTLQCSAQTGAVSTLVHTGRGCYKLVHFLLIQMWLSLRNQCAWEQCCDQKQRTGSHQCWPVWVAVQHGRAGKLRRGEPSLAAGCTLSPADQQLPSGAPKNRKPRQPSEDGSAPDRFNHNNLNKSQMLLLVVQSHL